MTEQSIDDLATWLDAYRHADTQIKQWTETKNDIRARITTALGEAETGTIAGRPAVRWTKVESSRLDVKKAKELLPAQVIAAITTVSTSRRFTLVEDGDE